ncbi:protein FAM184B [Rhinatrema bivittatum]|uniref:protein FAM184B n=1 Tax=Rhinatrema bivittatum TaxID=194408 RepID=UPI001129D9F5|nr:protein FAM184B [Rhinatrema bivittatum]
MMASGKVQQSGTCNGSKNDHLSSAEEYDQEIHMKMCKKIAQLTKVIYALNTKNDEHEASIHALKEAHQEEIDHITNETKEKILQYKNKAGEELDLRLRLQTLEDALEQDKKLKEEALADFATYRMQAEERELRSKAEHSERITTLSKEMLELKEDYENQLQHLKQEADSLRKECREHGRGNSQGKEKAKENHNLEMQVLLNELENLKSENRKITEEHMRKSDQLEATYEKEKEAFKETLQQSVTEKINQWQEQRQIIQDQETVLQQQRKKLEADLDAKSQKLNELKRCTQKMKERVQDLEMQLREARKETLESKNSLEKMEEELAVAKERLILQENEIHSKTEQMKTALISQNEAIHEVDELKSQIIQLQHKMPNKSNHGRKGCEDSTVLKQEFQEQLEELIRRSKNEKKQQEKEKEILNGKLQDCLLEVSKLENLVCQNQKSPENTRSTSASHQKKLKMEYTQELDRALCRIQSLQDFLIEREIIRVMHTVMTAEPTSPAQGAFQNYRQKEKKTKDDLTVQMEVKKEDKQENIFYRSECPYAFKTEDGQAPLKRIQKEKAIQTISLQEEWQNQRPDLHAQIAQLKETLEQQGNNCKEVLKVQELQSSKEKEKLFQDLQASIKQSQTMKTQLEALHQKTLKIMEKKKNQELKEAQERFRKEYNESLRREHQSHRLEIQALEKKAKQDLQWEHEHLQKQQSLILDSLREELLSQQMSCTSHKKQIEELFHEVKHLKGLKKQQEESKQNQMKTLKDELDKCRSEVSGFRKEKSLLKDTMQLLSAQVELQKQEARELQDREKQQRRLLEEDFKAKQKTETDSLRHDHKKEIQTVITDFNSTQACLQAKIVSLETELNEAKAKPGKRELRPEDLQLIGHLQDKLTEKDQIIKRLMDERKLQSTVPPNMETQRNRSFSCNPNHGCLTATVKKKKTEVPSRVVSVPNLASFDKNVSNCNLMPKSSAPLIAKSPSLDQKPCSGRPCQKSTQLVDSKPIVRHRGKEISKSKDSRGYEPKRPEWFTKYFSF